MKWCSAVPSHRHNCIITSCVSKDETGDNFMMWGENCKVHVDTQYPSKILNGFCGVHNCVAWKTLQIFFLSDQLDEGEHSKFLVFQYGSWSSLLSPQERQNYDFSNRQSTLHLFLEDVARCHTIHFHLDLGAKWWAQISCPITFWYKALVVVIAKNQGQLVF